MMKTALTAERVIAICLVLLTLYPPITGGPPLAQQTPPYQVVAITDLAYYDGPDFDPQKHLLDLFLPEGLPAAPVLIFVHGGAWVSGDKSLYSYIGHAFAQEGFVTVVINYRLTPEVVHPGHVQDVARAFAWVYQHIAQYGGDPERIFLSGHSAGGHLVALLALDGHYLADEGLSNDLIPGVIAISGIYDLTTIPGFNAVFGTDPQARREASPIAYVGPHPPPFLLLYAQFDLPTLDAQAEEFGTALSEQDGEVQVIEIPLRDHVTIVGLIGQPDDPTTEAMLGFLREHLIP